MTNRSPHLPGAEVLLAHGRGFDVPGWFGEVREVLRPLGLAFFRAYSGAEAIWRVERQGLAAAVLVADRTQIEPLSLLRIIRSIDWELPCWLVAEEATQQTLKAAMALRVRSVMTHPIAVNEFTQSLKKVLSERMGRN